jgi:FMN phosphatase YigB (HAD superfamily)
MFWRLRILTLVLAGLVVLGACEATVDVSVVVDDEQGAGAVEVTVVLDREAVERLEGIEQLRTADLVEAGWSVDEPVTSDDGAVTLAASKPFSGPGELADVLGEISGSDGPYGRLGLRVDRSFARTEYTFQGVLDGSGGIDAFADPGVAQELDGRPFGIDPAELEAELGVPLGSLIELRLAVELPGDQTPGDPAVGADADDSGASGWRTDLSAADPVPVLTTSDTLRMQSVVLALAALGFAVLFLVILLVWILVRLRRRRRRKRAARRAASTPRPIAEPDLAGESVDADEPTETVPAASRQAPRDGDQAATASAAATPPPLEMVIVGGPGAAFGVRDPVDDLVAFARAHGSMLEYPRIAEHYAQAELGRLSTAELWIAIGAEGDPSALDEEMLGQYRLAAGLREFVVRARNGGYRVAYLGDGPASWTDHLRRSFVLDDLIDPWVVSSSVGARTPEPAIFEAMRRLTAVDPASCLLIDDRLRVLEAARGLGFGTAWFSPTGRATEAPGHSIIRGFADLLAG